MCAAPGILPKADRLKRFQMEHLQATLSSFLEELDKRSQAINAISETRCGTSHAANDLASRFNNSVRNFIQEMLDDLQATVDKNKIMSESRDNSYRNAEMYRESFNTLVRATDDVMKTCAQFQADSARIGAIANSHIREAQMLRVRLRETEKREADLLEANRIMQEREATLLTIMRGQVAANQVIAGTNSVFAQLAEQMKQGTASMAEVDALKAQVADLTSENEMLKAQVADLTSENEMLTAQCEIQKSRMDELKEELEQLRKENEEIEKLRKEKEEELQAAEERKAKFIDACQQWKARADDGRQQIKELKQQIAEKDAELQNLAEEHEAELEALKQLYAARPAVVNPDDGTKNHEHHDAPEIDELIIPEDHKMSVEDPPSPEEKTTPEEEEQEELRFM